MAVLTKGFVGTVRLVVPNLAGQAIRQRELAGIGHGELAQVLEGGSAGSFRIDPPARSRR